MRFVTSSIILDRDLKKMCDGLHDHQGGGSGGQREFPEDLAKTICRGILKEKRQRKMKLKAVMEIGACPKKATKMPDVEQFHDLEELRMVTETLAWDELTGKQLDRGTVEEDV